MHAPVVYVPESPPRIPFVTEINMRIRIQFNYAVVPGIDATADLRRRSTLVREAVLAAVDRHRRTRLLRRAAGILGKSKHEWDD